MKKWNKPELMYADISNTEHGYPNCYNDGCFLGVPTHGPVNPNPDPDPTPDPVIPDPVDPDPSTDPLS